MLTELISECTDYDFKSDLESEKPRSWLKSVSAFANGTGGTLFFGIKSPDNVPGLANPQAVSDKISELVNERISPRPIYSLKPIKEGETVVLALSVPPGRSTPYYYRADGVCVAYIRSGNESVECPPHILNELVLKGEGKTYDLVVTGYRKSDFSFSILQSAFYERTMTRFKENDFVSFGLVDQEGMLTNAGLLLADSNPIRHSRLFATQWNGENKVGEEEVVDDREFSGSLLKQYNEALSFFRTHTKNKWHKEAGETVYEPDYDEEAIAEALVNGIVHRDYNNPGAEVCLNIYADRIEITSPGGMFSGEKVPEHVDYEMESMRRNPVIADLFWRMRLMNRRGSGLENITEKTNRLFHDGTNHVTYSVSPSFFRVRIENANFVATEKNEKKISISADRAGTILSIMRANPRATVPEISSQTGIPERTIFREIALLKNHGRLKVEGNTSAKIWVVVD